MGSEVTYLLLPEPGHPLAPRALVDALVADGLTLGADLHRVAFDDRGRPLPARGRQWASLDVVDLDERQGVQLSLSSRALRVDVFIARLDGVSWVELRVPASLLERVSAPERQQWTDRLVTAAIAGGAAIVVAQVDAPDDLFARAVVVDDGWVVDLAPADGLGVWPATVWVVDARARVPAMERLTREPSRLAGVSVYSHDPR